MPTYDEALKEAERLSKFSDEKLLEELGLRVEDEKRPGGAERAQAFSGDFPAVSRDMSSSALAALRDIGQRWWKKLQPQLMDMLCNSSNEDVQRLTGNKSLPQVAAGLATAALTASIAAPPAWVIVAATIVATKLAETGLEALCESWAEAGNPA